VAGSGGIALGSYNFNSSGLFKSLERGTSSLKSAWQFALTY